MKLFTGKAGLLVDGGITLADLGTIWLGNFIGTGIGSFMLLGMSDAELAPAARSIIENRMAAGDLENVVAGVICGILMYIATANWGERKECISPYYVRRNLYFGWREPLCCGHGIFLAGG